MNLTERLASTEEMSEEQLLEAKRMLFQEAKSQGVIGGLATIARQFGKELNANKIQRNTGIALTACAISTIEETNGANGLAGRRDGRERLPMTQKAT